MSRKKLGLALSSTFILFGFIDVFLRMFYLHSIREGLHFSIHDPGRMVHSFILMPVSIFVLVLNFPSAVITTTFLKYKIFASLFFIIMNIFFISQTYLDAKAGYTIRIPLPYDVKSNNEELAKLHHAITAKIKDINTRPDLIKEERINHIKRLKEPYIQAVNKVKGSAEDFWNSSSFYKKCSVVLSCLGLVYVAFLFTIVALFAIGRKRINDSFLKAIIINIAVLSSWFIFRAYSEWYLNLADFDVQKDSKFMILPLHTIILTLVIFFLYQKQKFISYLVSIAALIFALLSMITRLRPDIISSSFNFSLELSTLNIASLLFIGSFGLGAMLWNLGTDAEDGMEMQSIPSQESLVGSVKLPVNAAEEEINGSKFTLSDETIEKYISNINRQLEEERIYFDPELTLTRFASCLKMPIHHLSYVLNDKMRRGFSDLINHYRVEEAKKRLKDPAFQRIKIENIGYDCGFNSKATFYRVFKKVCEQSPAEFQKTEKEKAIHPCTEV